MILALLFMIAALLSYQTYLLGGIMAGEKELAERVKALEATLSAAFEAIGTVATEAAADIAKIHDLLDASTGSGADVAGANAALDAIEGKLAGIAETVAKLKEQVDRPEPGDAPPA